MPSPKTRKPAPKTRKPAPKTPSPKQTTTPHDAFFGPPPLLEGEDEAAYYDLLEKAKAHLKPRDVLEDIATRDFVDVTWEILRLRRMREPLIVAGHGEALLRILTPQYGHMRASELRDLWLSFDPDARREVAAYMKHVGLTMVDLHARAIDDKIGVIERIDRLIAQAEHRRRLVIGELDRRRDVFARRLRETANVIDVEVHTDEDEAAPLPAPIAKAS